MDCTHGLDRVDDQVEKYLLKLHAVTRDGRQAVGQIQLQKDLLPAQLLLRQCHHVTNLLVDVQLKLARRPAVYQRPDARR